MTAEAASARRRTALVRLGMLAAGLAAAGLLLRSVGFAPGTDWVDRWVLGQGLLGDVVFVAMGAAATAAGVPRQGVAFLGVQIDDDPTLLKPFQEEYKVNYPLLLANDRDDVQEAFGPFYGLPVTLMIQRDGTICKRHMGVASKAQMEKEIKNLL